MELLLQLMPGVGIARPRHLTAVKIGERQLPLALRRHRRETISNLSMSTLLVSAQEIRTSVKHRAWGMCQDHALLNGRCSDASMSRC